MTHTFGLPQPRMAGSKFFPTQRVSVVPRSRIPNKPTIWLEQFFPFPAVYVTYPSDTTDARLDVEAYIEQTCSYHGITRDELVGAGQSQAYVSVRRKVAAELNKRGWSTPQIGKLLNRDHSSVVYWLGRSKRNVKRRAAKEAKAA
jgi:hypothetical protein